MLKFLSLLQSCGRPMVYQNYSISYPGGAGGSAQLIVYINKAKTVEATAGKGGEGTGSTYAGGTPPNIGERRNGRPSSIDGLIVANGGTGGLRNVGSGKGGQCVVRSGLTVVQEIVPPTKGDDGSYYGNSHSHYEPIYPIARTALSKFWYKGNIVFSKAHYYREDQQYYSYIPQNHYFLYHQHYVRYQGSLYECIANTKGPFDPTKWKLVAKYCDGCGAGWMTSHGQFQDQAYLAFAASGNPGIVKIIYRGSQNQGPVGPKKQA